MTHQVKLKQILNLIDKLFEDTSVSPETTLVALEEIGSEVYMKAEAIKDDIKRGQK